MGLAAKVKVRAELPAMLFWLMSGVPRLRVHAGSGTAERPLLAARTSGSSFVRSRGFHSGGTRSLVRRQLKFPGGACFDESCVP